MPWKNSSKDGAYYPTPANPFPENFKCIEVLIPDDPIYWADFWGMFEYLTKWVAWPRDNQGTAAAVAALWRQGYDISREAFEAMEGCTPGPQGPQGPQGEPGPQGPQGPQGETGTCTCGGVVPDDQPPPETPPGYDPACYRANLIIAFLQKTVDMLAAAAGEEALLINLLPAIFTALGLIMSTGGIGALIIPVLNLILGTSGAAILLNFDDLFWGELKEIVYNGLFPVGELTEEKYQCMLQNIDLHSGFAWSFVKIIFQLAHANGIQNMESTAGGDDSGCEEFSNDMCPTSQTWDLTLVQGPFVAYQYPAGTPAATWAQGIGWTGGYNQYGQAVLCISTDRGTGDWKFEGLDLYGVAGGDDGVYHIDWVTAEVHGDGFENTIISADVPFENDFALHYTHEFLQTHYIVIRISFGQDPLARLTQATIRWKGWAPWVA